MKIICDWDNCKEAGIYKAPVEKDNSKTIDEINKIYDDNNLSYTYKKYSNINSINSLIPYLKNDKKNNDDKINFILLKKIGKTSLPNKNKISLSNLKKLSNSIARY